MEKRDKIIIAALVIVIIALGIGIASMFVNNSSAGNGEIPDGMQKYDFNSEFTMAVPKDARFLKEWNRTDQFNFGEGYSYFDRNNKFAVSYVDSPLVTNEFINSLVEVANKTGNVTINVEGDLIISHTLIANGKVGTSIDKTNFTESILIQKGHRLVVVQGNDLDFIKSMANTIEFYE